MDTSIIDTTPNPLDSGTVSKFKKKCLGSETKGKERKQVLNEFCHGNNWLEVFYAPNTFEVDFISAGNAEFIKSIVDDVYTDEGTRETSKLEISLGDKSVYGKRVLTMAAHEGKGWFAILLSNTIDDQVKLPEYILDAIKHSIPSIKDEIWFEVLSYRLSCIKNRNLSTPEIITWVESELEKYRNSEINTASIFDTFKKYFPENSIIDFTQRF